MEVSFSKEVEMLRMGAGVHTYTKPEPGLPVGIAPAAAQFYADVLGLCRLTGRDLKALEIATRESNLDPYSQNSCCSGLFQLYYNVHRTWLASIGITSASARSRGRFRRRSPPSGADRAARRGPAPCPAVP